MHTAPLRVTRVLIDRASPSSISSPGPVHPTALLGYLPCNERGDHPQRSAAADVHTQTLSVIRQQIAPADRLLAEAGEGTLVPPSGRSEVIHPFSSATANSPGVCNVVHELEAYLQYCPCMLRILLRTTSSERGSE